MWALFFAMIKMITANGFYQATESCAFKVLQNVSLGTELECAIKCDLADCKAFLFDKQASLCKLYAYSQVCQSNTKCINVTIFINNRDNEEVRIFILCNVFIKLINSV